MVKKRSDTSLQQTIERLCRDHPDEVMQALLSRPFWPEGLEHRMLYQRYDDDGEDGLISIVFTDDGDGSIVIRSERKEGSSQFSHRFCAYTGGGGRSRKTLAALRILATAIAMDNADNPQP